MNELMKRYEAETGKSSTQTITDGLDIWHYEYIEWLEAKVLNGETIEKFQEIIRTQCDEISALKAQLTWRPVSEKPEKADMYFAEVRPYLGNVDVVATTVYFGGERFLGFDDVIRWLPIPPAPEGE